MRDEPRGFTRDDKVALAVGLALGLLSAPGWMANAATFAWMGVGIFMRNSLGFWLLAVALGAVTLGRVRRYRRLPRPAEWLALTMVAWGIAILLPPSSHEELTTLVVWPLAFLNLSHVTNRWIACGFVATLILLGWQVARLGRSSLPTPVQAVWLTFLIFLALWSPLTTLSLHAADWFAPANGFGRGDAMVLYRGVCGWLAQTPLALLIGWPAVATAEDRLRGRPWAWHEMTAALAATLAALIAVVVFRGELSPLSWMGLIERVIVTAWLVGVTWLDLQLVRQARRSAVDTETATDNALAGAGDAAGRADVLSTARSTRR